MTSTDQWPRAPEVIAADLRQVIRKLRGLCDEMERQLVLEHGDPIGDLMRSDGLDFMSAVERLAQQRDAS